MLVDSKDKSKLVVALLFDEDNSLESFNETLLMLEVSVDSLIEFIGLVEDKDD
jgi:hypothetical protein